MILIYGATGYTGRLIAQEATRRGLQPILAGRTRSKLEALSNQLGGLEIRVFELQHIPAIAFKDVRVVLNTAGPFRQTAPALVNACLTAGTHYLDIAGEVPEFQQTLARDAEAKTKNIMLLPGVGFGVVPTDAVAAMLKERMPDATHLKLAFKTVGGASRGTAQSVLSYLPAGGVVRRAGRLEPLATGIGSSTIDFGAGLERALANPWRADLVTAFLSTGIQNIETFTVMPSPMRELVSLYPSFGWLLRTGFVQNVLNAQIAKQPEGPTPAERAMGRGFVWGEVRNAVGQMHHLCIETPDAYDFTAFSAVASLEQVLAGRNPSGFQTPSRAFGAAFGLSLPGVRQLQIST